MYRPMFRAMLRKGLTIAFFAMALCFLGFTQPFTYQGFLRQSGSPVNGAFDFRFRLWTALTGGSQVGSDQLVDDLLVENGLFTAQLNFGSVWDGSDRYLEIAVRPGASTGGYQELSPRVRITPTPYAIRALSATPSGAAGGDLSGSYPNPTVTRLQGRAVSTTAPAAGQVLKWDGSQWSPGSDLFESLWQTSGNNIFYTAGNVGIGTSSPSYRLHVTTSTGLYALHATNTNTPSESVYAIWGQTLGTAGAAIAGSALTTTGLANGVAGTTSSTSGNGVYGMAFSTTGNTSGVYGVSRSGSGRGVYGFADSATGITYGVYGISNSTSGRGVYGWASATTGISYGVRGESDSFQGTGVCGVARSNTGSTMGVYGSVRSPDGYAIYGISEATTGTNYAVYGVNFSTSGTGVYGIAQASVGATKGVYGESNSVSGVGVRGYASATTGFTYGVYGSSASTDGRGVYGYALALSGLPSGVYGRSDSVNGLGVWGYAPSTVGNNVGVRGDTESNAGIGMFGFALNTLGSSRGVVGHTRSSGSASYGVYGEEPSGGAGHAVYALGTLAASGTKSFQIDHPLRPETHYLNHFCAEGPEPYNIYRGAATLDARGEAWVQLPDYFEAINRDPVITLTPVGASMPNLYIAAEIQGNRFKIAGGLPGRKVYWRVEAVRNDPWVQRYGYQTEQEKEEDLRGKYLHPELYGQPQAKRIHALPEPHEENKPPR